MMGMMLLVPCLFAGLIIVALALGGGLLTSGLRLPTKPAPTAREVATRRYAQGEISKDQYDQILADISG